MILKIIFFNVKLSYYFQLPEQRFEYMFLNKEYEKLDTPTTDSSGFVGKMHQENTLIS